MASTCLNGEDSAPDLPCRSDACFATAMDQTGDMRRVFLLDRAVHRLPCAQVGSGRRVYVITEFVFRLRAECDVPDCVGNARTSTRLCCRSFVTTRSAISWRRLRCQKWCGLGSVQVLITDGTGRAARGSVNGKLTALYWRRKQFRRDWICKSP